MSRTADSATLALTPLPNDSWYDTVVTYVREMRSLVSIATMPRNASVAGVTGGGVTKATRHSPPVTQSRQVGISFRGASTWVELGSGEYFTDCAVWKKEWSGVSAVHVSMYLRLRLRRIQSSSDACQ